MNLYKEYFTLPNGTEIKFSLSFNKDKLNYSTYQPKKIGYQVTCIPVKRTRHEGYTIEESGCFTGFNASLLEVNRQSSKRLKEAIKIMLERKDEFLNYFINQLKTTNHE